MEERERGLKIQEKGATIRPKAAPMVSGKTTYTDYKKGNEEIENYFINQETKNSVNIQLMENYSQTKYHAFNEVGRKWDNDIALGNSMLLKSISIFDKTMNGKGNVFRLVGPKAWKEKFTELKAFLSKTPNYEGVSYRGIRIRKKADLESFLTRFSQDNIIETNTFWSTSANKEIAQSFAGDVSTGIYKINIAIEGKTGTILNKFARIRGEQEILFNAGTKYRVKSVTNITDIRNNIVDIVLEEI